MEIKGEDFLKNLEIEKEKLRLKEQSESLDKNKQSAIYSNSNDNPYSNYINDDEDNELDDIVLKDKKSNKQKYIILAFALILLFLITIIIIRLVSNPVNEDSFSNDNSLINDSKIQNISTKDKTIDQTLNDTNSNDIDIENTLDIEKTQKIEEKIISDLIKEKESNINKPQEDAKSDLFNINTNKLESKTANEDIKKETIKPKDIVITPKKVIKKETKNITTKSISGFYIQVGAFVKEPNPKLLKKLKSSKYKYILHKMTINNKLYTKVLVGPYKTRKEITNKLNNVKKITNNQKAYILELK